MADESIIANLQSKGFDELIKNLDASAKGFTLLETTIGEAQKKLSTLDKNSQDFKDLTKEINATKTAMDAYSQSTDTLKKDLRSTTDEIGKMERALQELEKSGQKNTQVYKDIATAQSGLKTKAGELKDTIGDLNAEIKNSGSDTKNLDKALRAINTVASGYQAAQGALVLFGGENKKFEQTLLKLNAVMAITQGLQQIQEEISKKDSVFTMAAAKAKLVYATAVGTSTGALKLFRIALLATGIGALIVGIGLLYANWEKLTDAILGSTAAQRRFNDDKKQALGNTVKERVELETLIRIQGDDNISRENKIALFREQQKLYPETLKNYTDEDFLLGKVNGAIKTQIELIKKRALITVTEQKLVEATKELEEQRAKLGTGFLLKVASTFNLGQQVYASQKESIKEAQKAVDEYSERLGELYQETNLGTVDVTINKKDKPEKKKDTKSNLNDLSKAQKKHHDDLEKLQKDHQKRLDDIKKKAEDDEQKRIEKELKDKQELRKAGEDLFKAEQKAAIETRIAKEKELESYVEAEDEYHAVLLKKKQEHAENVRGVIESVFAAFNAATSIATDAISVKTENELNALEEKRKRGIISEKQYQKESAKIKNEAAAKQRKVDIAMAAAQIPLVILQALSSAPPPISFILAAISGALAVAQVAILAAKPLPKFAKGVIDLQDSKSPNGVDTVHAKLSKGESVMTVEETREHKAVLQAIRNKTFNKLFVPANMVKQADIFANIPNPANMEISKILTDDYSSINERLDKLASEMWWIGEYTKQGNRQRVAVGENVVKNLQHQKRRYV